MAAAREKRAIVVGSRGQDGRLLTALLAKEGWRVRGVSRGGPVDILSAEAVKKLVRSFAPDEIYYLAALHRSSESRKPDSVAELEASYDVHVRGLLNFLEALAELRPRARLFYASSSRVYGKARGKQTERTPLSPADSYGLTKAWGQELCARYRARGLHVCAGILYNHQSHLQSEGHLSRKVALGALRALRGGGVVELGDMKTKVDRGWAPDYVEAMRLILRLREPGDFIVATGELHSAGELARAVCERLGLDVRKVFRERAGLVRSKDAPLRGDSSKLRRLTGWRPSSFGSFVDKLLACELAR